MLSHSNFVGILAHSRDGVIGKNGKLPWHSPTDLRWFKGLTKSHTVIMGRKTCQSLPGGKPLPDRLNIVVTRDDDFSKPGFVTAKSLKDAARIAYRENPNGIPYVIGGAELFVQALPYMRDAYVTAIDVEVGYNGTRIVMLPEFPASTINKTITLEHVNGADSSDYKCVVTHHSFNSPKSIFS